MSDPIAYALEKTQAEGVSPHVRPYVMEALVRQGSPIREVFSRFDVSDPERERVEQLLSGPSVWEAD